MAEKMSREIRVEFVFSLKDPELLRNVTKKALEDSGSRDIETAEDCLKELMFYGNKLLREDFGAELLYHDGTYTELPPEIAGPTFDEEVHALHTGVAEEFDGE